MTNEEATIILLSFVEHIYGHVVGVDVKLEEAIEMARDALTKRDNPPLTLEQLKQMDGEPVWCEDVKGWGIAEIILQNNKYYLHLEINGVDFTWDIKHRKLKLYAHKVEMEATP